jgi:hypothetical protein
LEKKARLDGSTSKRSVKVSLDIFLIGLEFIQFLCLIFGKLAKELLSTAMRVSIE